MNFGASIAAVWIGFMSFVGMLFHQPQTPPPPFPTQASTAQVQPADTSAANSNEQATPSTVPTQPLTQAQPQSPTTAHAATQSSSARGVTSTVLPSTGEAWETTLPLGDYKYSTSGPKDGYVYVCHIAQGGGGAQGKATWISGNVWYPAQKVSVEGSVQWPDATYSMVLSGSSRVIKGNGEPTDHPSGIFPIQRTDPAYKFDANPNSIKAQNYDFVLPADPSVLSSPDCIYGQVGIMEDGVPLFDGFDAEYRDAVAHETQDVWEAHPDGSGVYHYHGFETGFVKDPVSQVVGFAFDGFPITGSKMPDGTYLHTADLDECHGLTSTVTLDGKQVTTYHYVLTQDFPYSVSCFRGKSYEPKPGKGAQTNTQAGAQGTKQTATGSAPQQPPQAALDACSSKQSGSSCSFSTPNGTVTGTCRMPPNQTSLACVPN